ncbi:hypothetical protein CRG98_022546 [Punica granatum]|uniref:Integrase catalytic domain-containing protein n=1 Tax=Punica granatum TaxID=22663 RepID=A0A2I0JL89_PUNGR|nr:hypothetical protein CRG98_022546 [Punica granatum]
MDPSKVTSIMEWESPIKRVITEEPVLTLPCYGKPFEVETDASDFAIDGVLMQEGHPIAFESRKLSDIERRYTTQKKLSPKQARWQDFLAEFDFMMEYTPGKNNAVADALSRRVELAAISRLESPLLGRIKEGLQHEAKARILLELAREGKREILRECHDSKWAGHPGIHRTLALVEERYYWPQLRNDVETFMKTCLVCQQDKTEQKSPAGLLEPLPIPEHPWESVSMDFIVNLPKLKGCQTLMVVVDRFSKYATFISAKKECPAEKAAQLFMKHVVKYWGVPTTIMSDRDPRFTGRFWTELFKLLGTSLNFSTSLHSQTDGQTERVNALLELYLRHYPLTPSTVASGYKRNSPAAYRLAKSWQEEADLARSCLNRATKRMKKWADKKRLHVEYSVGDLVLVKLPKKLKLHLVFHVIMLKPFQEDKEDPSRAESSRALIGAKAAYDRDVEQVLVDRVVRKRWYKPKREYLIKWKGLPESEASWEPAEDLW